MGLGWQVWRACSLPAHKRLWIPWCLSHPALMQLLLYLLLLVMHTGRSMPVPGRRVFAELHKRAVLSAEYLHEDENNPVTKVEWRMLNKSKLILIQNVGNNSTCFGEYHNRTHYYFNNNTIILDAIRKEDEGVYQVSMVHKNTSVISVNITLSLVAVPPSAPRITVSMNNSLMVLVLKCEAEEGTELSYHWLKSGQSLPEDERHSLREENTTLQVNNLSSTDCVNYTCVAASDLGRTEEHFHLTGNTTLTCSANSTANFLNLKVILSISAAVICTLGLCVVIWCTNKHYQEIQQWLRDMCSKDRRTNSRRGQRRRTDEANVADLVYDEIRDEQAAPAAQEVVQLPYVYTDFIPSWHSAGRGQSATQIEDFGYSTIGPLKMHSPSPT
ncbi:hypothetical protein MATL_G00039970 [Megalops atlanticus]|uniref:Ig-like domain-containing protein n=1 Tax=Megalops atlanticus TaxID=7932 RepID=A0A9D3QA26_MEGAT|nr:hypothetical protein MATL_G00039970 [Megalops atlanticus]